MIRKLAKLHAEYGLYNLKLLAAESSRNIVDQLSNYPRSSYLVNYYETFIKIYKNEIKYLNKIPLSKYKTKATRSIDLPFVGSNVIKREKAEYFFIFEGSLSHSDRLSVVVLSCLWPIQNLIKYKKIIELFWPGKGQSSYNYIIKCLGINPKIAKKAYVTDAIRIADANEKPDRRKNRELLEKEIRLFDPKYVIPVGVNAKHILGVKNIKKLGDKCKCVPFPTKFRSWENKVSADKEYRKLKKLISNSDTKKRVRLITL